MRHLIFISIVAGLIITSGLLLREVFKILDLLERLVTK